MAQVYVLLHIFMQLKKILSNAQIVSIHTWRVTYVTSRAYLQIYKSLCSFEAIWLSYLILNIYGIHVYVFDRIYQRA